MPNWSAPGNAWSGFWKTSWRLWGGANGEHWGSVYVGGLLLDGERKSVEPMAKRLPDGNGQAMQQFVGREAGVGALSQRMVRELEPDALWVIDDTGFPEHGEYSVGVARQYSGALGKTANCQVAVSLHEVCTEGAAVLNGRLYSPESWMEDVQRRAETRHPEGGEVSKEMGTGFRGVNGGERRNHCGGTRGGHCASAQ